MIYSTQEDIDGRTGARRFLVDEYHLHANAVDVIRLALLDKSAQYIYWMNDDKSAMTASYWADELWEIDKALRALGIED